MQYYRCKCDKHEAWGSDSPPRCSVCESCGSDLSTHPDFHGEPVRHEFSDVDRIQTDQGEATVTRCRYCHRTEAEIDRKH